MDLNNKGYIYLRDNVWYLYNNVIKMGITSNITDRSNGYITGEFDKGYYLFVIEIDLIHIHIVDKMLKKYFKYYNIYNGGGTEFYDRRIINDLLIYIQKLNIIYTVLSQTDINNITRTVRLKCLNNIDKIKQILNQLNVKQFIQRLKIYKNNKLILVYKPNEQQQYVLNNIYEFYQNNNIGKIIWACGLGKALLCILIIKLLSYKKILIGVPSINLQNQMKNEILKIFNNKSNILFIGGKSNCNIRSTNNLNDIILFLNNTKNNQPIFIITVYNSCKILVNDKINFDFKIGDEAHHLAHEGNTFTEFHNIYSYKSLFMTATEKIIISNKEVYSMDNEYYFGKLINFKSVSWAINNQKITDYNVLILHNTELDIDNIINDIGLSNCNKLLFISCFMCLMSFVKYNNLTHILLYTNNIIDAELCTKYINILLNSVYFNFDSIYNNDLHSNKKYINIPNEINSFKSKKYGIISCVSLFGEGFDLPKLNGVCIACNMQSEIRIIQYLLRPNRLDISNPSKIAYIIIPSTDIWLHENSSYNNIKVIITQLRIADSNIEQKIFISNLNYTRSNLNDIEKNINHYHFNLCYNVNDLNKLKLKLRHSNSLLSNLSSEQNEYNYIQIINKQLHLNSKQEYIESRYIHEDYIIDPDIHFKLIWLNWYDFLGTDTSVFIQDKANWLIFCKKLNIISVDMYYNCCIDYIQLPKNPAEFYKKFTNISNELNFYNNRRKK